MSIMFDYNTDFALIKL